MNAQEQEKAMKKIKDTLAFKTAKAMSTQDSNEGKQDVLSHMSESNQVIKELNNDDDDVLIIMFVDGSILMFRHDKEKKETAIIPLCVSSVLTIIDQTFPYEGFGKVVRSKTLNR